MSLWILDTDHVSAVLRGNDRIIQKATQHYPHAVITIVTVQELFNGWIAKINQTTDSKRLVNLYGKLNQTLDLFEAVAVLNFDETARRIYEELRGRSPILKRKRFEKDLRIASICLANDAIMVTRNTKDFILIPNLVLENWFDS